MEQSADNNGADECLQTDARVNEWVQVMAPVVAEYVDGDSGQNGEDRAFDAHCKDHDETVKPGVVHGPVDDGDETELSEG